MCRPDLVIRLGILDVGNVTQGLTMLQGLAYSVSGGWNTTPADHVGLFVAGGDTAKPAEFLTALRRVLQVCHLAIP